jgi:hypothetical protein
MYSDIEFMCTKIENKVVSGMNLSYVVLPPTGSLKLYR